MPPERTFVFSYADLATAIGGAKNTVVKHVARGYVDTSDLESLVVYLARYGRLDLREKMVGAMLRRDAPGDPGGGKRRKRKNA
jgi:hypothetical protein